MKQKAQNDPDVSPVQFYCGTRRAYNSVFEKYKTKYQQESRNIRLAVKIQEMDDRPYKYWQS